MPLLDNHNAYIRFWEEVAKNFSPISHDRETHKAFARILDNSRSPFMPYYYTEEFNELLADGMQFPCLVVESTQDSFDYPNQMFQEGRCGILVLLATENNNDFDSVNNAVSSAKQYCGNLLGYLRQYLKDYPAEGHLQLSSIRIVGVGPINDNLHGARAEFTIDSPTCALHYDPDQWINPV